MYLIINSFIIYSLDSPCYEVVYFTHNSSKTHNEAIESASRFELKISVLGWGIRSYVDNFIVCNALDLLNTNPDYNDD